MKRIFITFVLVVFFQLNSQAQNTESNTIFTKDKQITANFPRTVWIQQLVPEDSIFNLVAGSNF
ncbi:MAG TPA: hypothetical protein VF842_11920 [Flavobacterium sp.]